MKHSLKLLLVSGLLCLCSLQYGLYARTMSEEDYQELVEIINQLEISNETQAQLINEQETVINNLQISNDKLQKDSENKQQILNEQENLINNQGLLIDQIGITFNEQKKSYLIATSGCSLLFLILGFLFGWLFV